MTPGYGSFKKLAKQLSGDQLNQLNALIRIDIHAGMKQPSLDMVRKVLRDGHLVQQVHIDYLAWVLQNGSPKLPIPVPNRSRATEIYTKTLGPLIGNVRRIGVYVIEYMSIVLYVGSSMVPAKRINDHIVRDNAPFSAFFTPDVAEMSTVEFFPLPVEYTFGDWVAKGLLPMRTALELLELMAFYHFNPLLNVNLVPNAGRSPVEPTGDPVYVYKMDPSGDMNNHTLIFSGTGLRHVSNMLNMHPKYVGSLIDKSGGKRGQLLFCKNTFSVTTNEQIEAVKNDYAALTTEFNLNKGLRRKKSFKNEELIAK